ncbi:Integrase [Tenacibaculum maritimum]|uniref:site-specific integrase n=1 Tax=Tenacibaculum maritimum TaxID=107401 RepID=UPI0012E484A0|nr:site-specific integrase [Tenacibaculum maritimum]CAA0193819.1 Integrase [Tenacibaculum maritimum]
MNDYKISILFLLNKVKINKKGLCPVRCRITYSKTRKIFSTGLFINPDYWNSKQQLAKPPNKQNNITNTHLSLISQKINEAFLLLQISSENFDVDDIYRKYKGEDVKTEITILGAYDLHNEKTKKLIGVDFNKLSWSRYVASRNKVAGFIKKFYKKRDVKLKDLDLKFIMDLEYYFKTELHLKHATIYRSMQRVKKIIQFAIAENYLQRDPFNLYKNSKYKPNIIYLTTVELQKIEEHKFSQNRLQQVKDLFIFCCYTGLPYQEMTNLTHSNIIKNFDGNLWIQMKRQKTDKPISVPLLPPAKLILDKYQTDDRVLPKISNQKFNSYLKEIGEILEINKKMTHHLARRTFATTILLYNDVPMEIVSELLGHAKMSITQDSYGKIVQKKVSEQMGFLVKKITKK